MHPDTMLGITISATIHRHIWDQDPTALLAEIRELAGDRGDILAEIAGIAAGADWKYPQARPVCEALLTIPGAADWFDVGVKRSGDYRITYPEKLLAIMRDAPSAHTRRA